MKNTFKHAVRTLGLAIVAMIAFSACSKDNEDLIIGKWKLVNTVVTEHGRSFTEEATDNEAMEFKKDGTVVFTSDSDDTDTGKWTLTDDTNLTITYTDEEDGTETMNYTITKLDKKELVINMTVEEEEENFSVTMNLKKL